ncbi:hypothetical protein RJT34_27444 [Clitoria ternatea]|uniref:Ribosomal protein L27 n=1 Tax=Clitoria ternatea TaxID=43366 RepID=A0AAN9IAZ9_CLITE
MIKGTGEQRVIPGNITVRQCGTRFHPGNYVGIGNNHILFALKEGLVNFEQNKLTGLKWVHVEPKEGHILHPFFTDASASELKITVIHVYLVTNSEYFDAPRCSICLLFMGFLIEKRISCI